MPSVATSSAASAGSKRACGTHVPAAITLATSVRTPIVWKSGMTPSVTSPGRPPVWMRWATAAACSAAWVRGTPFGRPVVPDV